MHITFDCPFGFSADSTPDETKTANRVLRKAIERLNAARGSGVRATMRRPDRTLFTFDLPALFCAESTAVHDGAALQILLEALIALNRAFLVGHAVPTLYRSGVFYGRTEVWDTIPALYARGYGDCKSVSAALIAEYLKDGKECAPVFRWLKTQARTKDYHILVLTPEGFEDPSKVLGMGALENARG